MVHVPAPEMRIDSNNFLGRSINNVGVDDVEATGIKAGSPSVIVAVTLPVMSVMIIFVVSGCRRCVAAVSDRVFDVLAVTRLKRGVSSVFTRSVMSKNS